MYTTGCMTGLPARVRPRHVRLVSGNGAHGGPMSLPQLCRDGRGGRVRGDLLHLRGAGTHQLRRSQQQVTPESQPILLQLWQQRPRRHGLLGTALCVVRRERCQSLWGHQCRIQSIWKRWRRQIQAQTMMEISKEKKEDKETRIKHF